MMGHSRLGAVWVLLAAVAAIELYDELPPTELDDAVYHQDLNDIDTGPFQPLHAHDTDTTRLKDLLLFRLIRSYMRDEPQLEHRMHNELGPTLGRSAGRLAKRFAHTQFARPQQRWKAKKGKVIGSQMVCYFKLCAFRNPA